MSATLRTLQPFLLFAAPAVLLPIATACSTLDDSMCQGEPNPDGSMQGCFYGGDGLPTVSHRVSLRVESSRNYPEQFCLQGEFALNPTGQLGPYERAHVSLCLAGGDPSARRTVQLTSNVRHSEYGEPDPIPEGRAVLDWQGVSGECAINTGPYRPGRVSCPSIGWPDPWTAAQGTVECEGEAGQIACRFRDLLFVKAKEPSRSFVGSGWLHAPMPVWKGSRDVPFASCDPNSEPTGSERVTCIELKPAGEPARIIGFGNPDMRLSTIQDPPDVMFEGEAKIDRVDNQRMTDHFLRFRKDAIDTARELELTTDPGEGPVADGEAKFYIHDREFTYAGAGNWSDRNEDWAARGGTITCRRDGYVIGCRFRDISLFGNNGATAVASGWIHFP